MKNAPMDEPTNQPDSDDQNEDAPIIAVVGSSALGATDIRDEDAQDDVEPRTENTPDNDGETVEG